MSTENKDVSDAGQLADPRSIAGLVNYADGSVVSRTVVKNPAGNITLFSFAQGQGLSEHSAPYDAFVMILEGQAELTIGGRKMSAKTGECVLMPANIPHALLATSPFKMLLVMIRG